MLDAIVFDLDGTLADITHRLHFVKNGKKDWDSFFRGIPQDQPIPTIIDLARTLIKTNEKSVLFATGRPERTRSDTEAWLIENGVNAKFETSLFMRRDGDQRPDTVVKRELLTNIRKAGFEPVLIFDDRQSVVDMWRGEGIRVAQVGPGNF